MESVCFYFVVVFGFLLSLCKHGVGMVVFGAEIIRSHIVGDIYFYSFPVFLSFFLPICHLVKCRCNGMG